MSGRAFGHWICEPTLPEFRPERRDSEMEYAALRCACGSDAFRASGWPNVARGSGSYFWRALTRVWREARQATRDGEPVESPFLLPLWLQCAACGREEAILSAPESEAAASRAAASEPREAYRCRVCRRAVMRLVVGMTPGAAPAAREYAAAEVLACCTACRREARIAWSDDRPSKQELQLDLLYGRR